MSLGKIVAIIITITALAIVLSFVFLKTKYSYTVALIGSSIIVFSFLIWLNDKHFNERINIRVFSIKDKKFVQDVITRQMNMHGITKVVEKENTVEYYRGKHLAGKVKFRTDQEGKPVKVDDKYIIEVEAPEYILHNIDHEVWSLIGKRK
ncbi:MAG: hypothetical protein GXO22_08560 [Aquificae bacterium]|nr:hypothetical protein [Aquificota bacterium]